VICGADYLVSHLSIKLEVQQSGEDFKDGMGEGGFNKKSKIIHRHSSNIGQKVWRNENIQKIR